MVHTLMVVAVSIAAHTDILPSVTHSSADLKAEAHGEKLEVKAAGKTVASFDCSFSKPLDYDLFNTIIQEAGVGGSLVTLDLSGLSRYCELKRTQQTCLYDGKKDGCSPEEMKKLEQANMQGFDLVDIVEDLPRFITGRKPASKGD